MTMATSMTSRRDAEGRRIALMSSIAVLAAASVGGFADAFVVNSRASSTSPISGHHHASANKNGRITGTGYRYHRRRRTRTSDRRESTRGRTSSSVLNTDYDVGSGFGGRNDTSTGGFVPALDPPDFEFLSSSSAVDDALALEKVAAAAIEKAGVEVAAIAAAVAPQLATADTSSVVPLPGAESEGAGGGSGGGGSVFFDDVVEEAVGTDADSDASEIPPGSALFEPIEEEEVQQTSAEATDVVKVDEEDDADAPSVRQILRFAVSAIGVWLCSPILSMIDTSAVGLLAGTAQQAALNPAVSVTDYGGLLVAFMYTATTNLVAAAQQTDRSDPSRTATTRTVVSAMRLALLVGVGFGLTLSVFGRVLLRTLIGNDALDPAIFSAALRYVRIRALGMPAAVVIGTAQSACLGMKDLKSPLYVLAAAAVINGLGDAVFVRSPSLWIGGAAGAAWATVFSQYAALFLFVRWFRTKPGDTRRSMFAGKRAATRAANLASRGEADDDDDDADEDVSARSDRGRRDGNSSPSSRGLLSGRFNLLDLFRKPESDIARNFLPYVAPVTATSVGRISGYLAMSHVASSALGTVDMAAQQIILSFFCCLCPVSDSLNLTAQSFVPSIFARPWGKGRSDALRRAMSAFVRAGWIIGAALVVLCSLIPLLGHLFTTDPAVLAQVNTAVPGVALFFALSGFIMVGEGMFLGQHDLKFLGNIYGAFFFAVPAVLLRLKRRALAGLQDVGVGTMWTTFSAYQVVRFFIWAYRMRWLQNQRDAEGEPVAVAASKLRP